MNIKELTKGLEEFISTDSITESLNKLGDDSRGGEIRPMYGIPPVKHAK